MSRPHPFLRGLRRPLHIAHRGGAGLAPENTLEAFEQAVRRYQTDLLELDLQLSADGELVVFHDATLERCTNGEGPLKQRTLAELQRLDAGYRFTRDQQTYPFRSRGIQIPSFREVLRKFSGMRINVDLKSEAPPIVDAFAALLHEEAAVERVCCGSESDPLSARILQALPGACQFYPRQALIETVMAIKTGEPVPRHDELQVLELPLFYEGERLVDAPFMRAADALGKWVFVWTVDDPAQMAQAAADGVGGIMTDRPDLLRQVLTTTSA